MSVHYGTDGAIAVIMIDRPEARNAVDGPTAAALVEAFRRFDGDDAVSVAVLTGAGGTFCAGADLKGISAGRGNRIAEDGDAPMGPSRSWTAARFGCRDSSVPRQVRLSAAGTPPR